MKNNKYYISVAKLMLPRPRLKRPTPKIPIITVTIGIWDYGE